MRHDGDAPKNMSPPMTARDDSKISLADACTDAADGGGTMAFNASTICVHSITTRVRERLTMTTTKASQLYLAPGG